MMDLPRQLNYDRVPPMRRLLREVLRGREQVNMLEIGSFAGESAKAWLSESAEHPQTRFNLLCVDPWQDSDNYFVADGLHYLRTKKALRDGSAFQAFLAAISVAQSFQKVSFLKDSSQSVLPTLPDKTYDIIYIDGNHAYSGISFDIRQAMRLIRDGGVICGDDLELTFSEVEQNHCRMYRELDFIKDPVLNKTFHPGVTFALSEVPHPIYIEKGVWWFTPVSGCSPSHTPGQTTVDYQQMSYSGAVVGIGKAGAMSTTQTAATEHT